MASVDKELGLEIKALLKEKGLETPMVDSPDFAEAQHCLSQGISQAMQMLGLDLNDDSLVETPDRVAKMYCQELFEGLDYNKFPKCTVVENKFGTKEMVVSKGIATTSVCEHHFQTIDGFTYIGYIPKDKVLGLSKFSRVVGFFMRRPQVQERLTEQVYAALAHILGTDDVAVYQDCVHYCMKARGVRESEASTVTSKMGGKFMSNPALRAEFYEVCRAARR